MSPSAKRSSARSARTLCTLTAVTALTACAPSMPRSVPSSSQSPLVVASCPPLQPLTDDTFGATTAKLVDVAVQYRKCRAAALMGEAAGLP